MNSRAPAASGHGAAYEMPAPGRERQEQHDRRQVPRDWMVRSATTAPQAPSKLRGAARVGVVEARVVHRPGGEACPGGAGDGDENQAVAAKHEPPQAGRDRARQEPPPLLLLFFLWPSLTQSGDDARQSLACASPASCTSATLTWSLPGLIAVGPARGRDTCPGSSLTPHPFQRVFAAASPPPKPPCRARERSRPPGAGSRTGRPESRRRRRNSAGKAPVLARHGASSDQASTETCWMGRGTCGQATLRKRPKGAMNAGSPATNPDLKPGRPERLDSDWKTHDIGKAAALAQGRLERAGRRGVAIDLRIALVGEQQKVESPRQRDRRARDRPRSATAPCGFDGEQR